MHVEALGWIRAARHAFDDRVLSVVEVGSQDINGSPRSLPCLAGVARWVGIDVFDRPGVDWVGLAHRYPLDGWDGEPFDALVSCECFEHDPYWRRSLLACGSLVRPGGLIAVTCATGERAPHGVEADTPTPGYYGNVSPGDMRDALLALGVVGQPLVKVERGNMDLCAMATRAEAAACGAMLGADAGFDPSAADLDREWLLAVRRAVATGTGPFGGD